MTVRSNDGSASAQAGQARVSADDRRLDEALDETFPASDAVSFVQLAPDRGEAHGTDSVSGASKACVRATLSCPPEGTTDGSRPPRWQGARGRSVVNDAPQITSTRA
ncbi:hypothetical protein Rmf_42860 [Roseomonas fluvialis]|uniref:Uncharacterized protein n=2 Tax=Roseomonas fluvialis TaxID=1750527 RepID=A0ABN6P6P9_9PROT|nr:hypothetical protein Rmf_42860 [Roseomonas fluvialis]